MGDRAMHADGGTVARARGGKAEEREEEHERKRGGRADSEDTTKGMESYTAKPNEVEEEAEGKERKRGGKTRADGGVAAIAARARGGRSPELETEAEEEREEEKKKREHRARGGALKHLEMEGAKTKHRRLDRPGRKRGGAIGADMTPLSSAARTREAEDHKADGDELAE